MKVTLVNHSDIVGGASVVSLRLLEALRAQGVDARMIVNRASGQKRNYISEIGGIKGKATFLAERLWIFANNGLDRSNLFKVSTADCGLAVHRHPWIADADIVALNWFNQGMMSLKEIYRIAATGKPIVWTMHDMWPMTGICHHAADCEHFMTRCGKCPLLGRGSRHADLSTKIFDLKKSLYENIPINFVAVSRWLATRAADSTLLRHRHVEVINNAFPIDRYATVAQQSRKELGLPDDNSRLVIMCAARLDDPIKDLPSAISALNDYDGKERITAVFCGNIRYPETLDRLNIPYVHLGNITDHARLANIYAHSSVVISSSSFESLPSTLIEGMAAGAVPVGYGGDGRDEIIDHLSTGYLARKGDYSDMARGIEWAISSAPDRKFLHEAAALKFDAPVITKKYIDLFNRILSNK